MSDPQAGQLRERTLKEQMRAAAFGAVQAHSRKSLDVSRMTQPAAVSMDVCVT